MRKDWSMAEKQPSERVDVRICGEAARAVWAAMHDDDDLAEDYVNVCVVHGLNHLVEDLGPEPYTTEEWDRIRFNLRAAREVCKKGEEEMMKRWTLYNEPPF
jgi:predicted HD phosphohydrolase